MDGEFIQHGFQGRAAVPGLFALLSLACYATCPKSTDMVLFAIFLATALAVFLFGCVLDVLRLNRPRSS